MIAYTEPSGNEVTGGSYTTGPSLTITKPKPSKREQKRQKNERRREQRRHWLDPLRTKSV